MKVTNNTSYALVAFGWHLQKGYGEDVTIKAGETKEVSGPYLGEMGELSCYVLVPGEISCQETPDDDTGYQVSVGNQLNLKRGNVGITVRHNCEPRIIVKAA